MSMPTRLMAAAIIAAAWAPWSQAEEAAPEAVYCPKCKVTAVRNVARERGKLFTQVGHNMTCPDCRTALQNFLAGESFDHTCKICGDLVSCKAEQEESKAAPSKETAAPAIRAASCDKCETTWVYSPSPTGKLLTFQSKRVMTCADCKEAARAYAETGIWSSSCGMCRDTLKACH